MNGLGSIGIRYASHRSLSIGQCRIASGTTKLSRRTGLEIIGSRVSGSFRPFIKLAACREANGLRRVSQRHRMKHAHKTTLHIPSYELEPSEGARGVAVRNWSFALVEPCCQQFQRCVRKRPAPSKIPTTHKNRTHIRKNARPILPPSH